MSIKKTLEKLKKRNINVKVEDKIKDLIVDKGTDFVYGARPLRRAIQNMLEDKIAEAILDGVVKTGKKAKAIVENDEIVIK